MKVYKNPFILIILSAFFLSCSNPGERDIEFVKGYADASSIDFSKDLFLLSGEWEFYPGEFKLDFDNTKKKYIKVPGVWTGSTGTPYGYATYRLKLKVDPGENIYSLKLKRIVGAYDLYINKKFYIRNGKPGRFASTSRSAYVTQTISFINDKSGFLDIVLHVSNFHDPSGGGLFQKIYLGGQNKLYNYNTNITALQLFIIGCILMSGIYHIVIFLFRRTDVVPLFFGLYCLVMAFRPMFLDETFIHRIILGIPWEVAFKIEIFTVFGSSPLLSILLSKLYKDEIDSTVINIYTIVVSMICVFLVVLRAPYFIELLKIFYITTIIATVYVYVGIISAVKRKRQGSIIFLIGFSVFLIAMVNDILFAINLIHTDFMMQYGMFVFVVAQTFVVAQRFTDNFSMTEKLNSELYLSKERQLLINKDLEKVIDERKNQLEKEIAEKEKMKWELIKHQKLEAVGILAGGIAHDLNNLLTIIMGNIFLSKEMTDNDDIKTSLEDAEKAGQRATEIANQLLTFSRGGSPVKAVSSIVELIKSTALLSLRGSNIVYNFNFGNGIKNCRIDQGQISQVISNIVINAKQAMENGGSIDFYLNNVFIKEKNKHNMKSGNYVELKIKDTGHGIPEKLLGSIFDPFFTTKKNGKGLGLSLSYSIIQKHEGYIFVESQINKGTLFAIYLPSTDEVEEGGEAGIVPDVSGSGKILIVDDETNILNILSRMVGQLGFEAVTAENGDVALDIYEKSLIDNDKFICVILDLTIPGSIGGKEIMQRIRAVDPEAVGIVSSGYSNNQVMSEPDKYGFTGVLKKPYTLDELSLLLNRVINKK